MRNGMMEFTCADKKVMSAYAARPAVVPAPAVIVLMEMYGMTEWLRGFTDWIAQSGFLALAPDTFHRLEPNLALNKPTEAEYNRVLRMYKEFDYAQGTQDLISMLDGIRKMPECNGKVATLGFCFGGKLSYCMAARSSADCNISFYPVGLEKQLTEPIKTPFLLHAALCDPYISAEAQEQVHRTLAKQPQAAIFDYPDCGHAFMRSTCEHFNASQAELARARCLEFLKKHLLAAVTI